MDYSKNEIDHAQLCGYFYVVPCMLPVGKMVASAATAARQNVDSRRSIAAVDWLINNVINDVTFTSR